MSAMNGLLNLRARLPLSFLGNERVAGRAPYKWDPWLLGSVLVLMTLGTIMVYSASVSIAEKLTGNSLFYLTRHAISLALGLVVLAAAWLGKTRLIDNVEFELKS